MMKIEMTLESAAKWPKRGLSPYFSEPLTITDWYLLTNRAGTVGTSSFGSLISAAGGGAANIGGQFGGAGGIATTTMPSHVAISFAGENGEAGKNIPIGIISDRY